jgi:PAS domain S-box-containing protein
MRILRVLYVEDSERDVAVVTRHLVRAGCELTVDRVETAKEMRTALQAKEWDLILCDYTMPQFNALAALALLQESKLDIPFIIISGTIGEQTAVEAMIAGAQDYLMKDNLVRLSVAVEREVQEAQNRHTRRKMEAALLESEDRYRDLVEHSLDLICTHDLEGRILSVNQTAVKLLGYDKKTLLGRNIRDILFAEHPYEFHNYIDKLLNDGIVNGMMSVKTKAGKRLIWEYTNTVRTEGVTNPVVRGIAHDITERKQAETALRASEVQQRHLSERQAAILDALPAHICLLGGDGNILAVNEPWRKFALNNKFSGGNFGIGINYLDICDRSKEIASKRQNKLPQELGLFYQANQIILSLSIRVILPMRKDGSG